MLFISTTGYDSHMMERREKRKKDGTTLNMNRTHQCSFVTQQIDEGDPSNIQVNIYTLQEREPMVQ
jgi:TATA-binding protein-associated factor Taf7